jgi:hypothetical protein
MVELFHKAKHLGIHRRSEAGMTSFLLLMHRQWKEADREFRKYLKKEKKEKQDRKDKKAREMQEKKANEMQEKKGRKKDEVITSVGGKGDKK